MKLLDTPLITKTMKEKIEKGKVTEVPKEGKISKKILVYEDGTVVLINPLNAMAICKNKAYKECHRCYDVTNYQLEIFTKYFIS